MINKRLLFICYIHQNFNSSDSCSLDSLIHENICLCGGVCEMIIENYHRFWLNNSYKLLYPPSQCSGESSSVLGVSPLDDTPVPLVCVDGWSSESAFSFRSSGSSGG